MERKQNRESPGDRKATTIRASISFQIDIYKSLEIIAKEKKVSLAWVVRDAVERYVHEQELSLEKK